MAQNPSTNPPDPTEGGFAPEDSAADSAADAGSPAEESDTGAEFSQADIDTVLAGPAEDPAAVSIPEAGGASIPAARRQNAVEPDAPDAGDEHLWPTSPVELPDFSPSAAPSDEKQHSIDLLHNVNLRVRVELGRTHMKVEDVLNLGDGSVVELDKLAGDPVEIFANDRLIARGEVLVLNDNFCVRVNEITDSVAAGA
jgi:flagellar motor switch protein FliN/FliY